MQIIIYILLGIVGLIGILLIIALFTRKNYGVQEEITIQLPANEVFDYLKHLINQEKFSKWVMTDPAMKKTLTGEDGTIGFIYAWDSQNKQAGAGEQEIMGLEPSKFIDVEVRFLRPFKGVAKTPFTIQALTETETRVIWGMSSKMVYPMNIMLLFNIENILAKDLKESLNNLKVILEK
ncbi:MAG: SRPBCC family protein [Crocinitomicaceae bacterium]|nr:SRPBCC family protein [Crocinitomicaceae bacterium]